MRRSIYFIKNLKQGDKIKKNNIILLRPYNNKGIKIENLKKILGATIKKKS